MQKICMLPALWHPALCHAEPFNDSFTVHGHVDPAGGYAPPTTEDVNRQDPDQVPHDLRSESIDGFCSSQDLHHTLALLTHLRTLQYLGGHRDLLV